MRWSVPPDRSSPAQSLGDLSATRCSVGFEVKPANSLEHRSQPRLRSVFDGFIVTVSRIDECSVERFELVIAGHLVIPNLS